MKDMPKIQHTIVRNRIYYMRQRIPTDLVESYEGKKQIVISLGTSSPAEAQKKLAVARLHILADFESRRKKLVTKKQPGRSLESFSELELTSLVLKWLRVFIDHRQRPDLRAVFQPLRHEVIRPDMVRPAGA